MQTFLPYPDFTQSAQVLDYKRLGKQRVECKQILNALQGNGGWQNHPAVKMWRGHEAALLEYSIEICREWISRGYNDSLLPFFEAATPVGSVQDMPAWFGDEAFHDSHKSNLIRKLPGWYRRYFGYDFPDDLEYVWPVN